MVPEAENWLLTGTAVAVFLFVFKTGLLLLAVLYFIFSLIIVRQVRLMTQILITEVSPLLRAFSIMHAGFALGIIILLIGFLF